MFCFRNFNLIGAVFFASLPMVALPTLRVSTNGTDWNTAGVGVTITDNGVGDLAGSAGSIVYAGSLGTWTLNVSTASTTGSGTTNFPFLSLVNNNIASAAGTLFIEFSETGFGANPFAAIVSSGGTNSPGATTTSQSFVDGTNALFGGVVPYTTFTSSDPSYQNDQNGGFLPLTSYSLTLKTQLVATSAAVIGSTVQLTGVPEPGFYGALALGLSGLFAAFARRRSAMKA